MIAAKQWPADKPLPDPEQFLMRDVLDKTLKDMNYVPTKLDAARSELRCWRVLRGRRLSWPDASGPLLIPRRRACSTVAGMTGRGLRRRSPSVRR